MVTRWLRQDSRLRSREARETTRAKLRARGAELDGNGADRRDGRLPSPEQSWRSGGLTRGRLRPRNRSVRWHENPSGRGNAADTSRRFWGRARAAAHKGRGGSGGPRRCCRTRHGEEPRRSFSGRPRSGPSWKRIRGLEKSAGISDGRDRSGPLRSGEAGGATARGRPRSGVPDRPAKRDRFHACSSANQLR
jgi:hypothetical protein